MEHLSDISIAGARPGGSQGSCVILRMRRKTIFYSLKR